VTIATESASGLLPEPPGLHDGYKRSESECGTGFEVGGGSTLESASDILTAAPGKLPH